MQKSHLEFKEKIKIFKKELQENKIDLNIQPPEPSQATIDINKAQAYINSFATEGHRALAYWMVNNLQYISFDSLKAHVCKLMNTLHTHLASNGVIDTSSVHYCIEREHSSEWITNLALPYFKNLPSKENLIEFKALGDIVEFSNLNFDEEIKTTVHGKSTYILLDDWIISGNQCISFLEEFDNSKLNSNTKNEQVNLIVAAAFITNHAKEYCLEYEFQSNVNFKLITGSIIPTIYEAASYHYGGEKLQDFLDDLDEMMVGGFEPEHQVLAFSDWKKLDHASMPEAFSNGITSMKVSATASGQFNQFIPEVISPYHKNEKSEENSIQENYYSNANFFKPTELVASYNDKQEISDNLSENKDEGTTNNKRVHEEDRGDSQELTPLHKLKERALVVLRSIESIDTSDLIQYIEKMPTYPASGYESLYPISQCWNKITEKFKDLNLTNDKDKLLINLLFDFELERKIDERCFGDYNTFDTKIELLNCSITHLRKAQIFMPATSDKKALVSIHTETTEFMNWYVKNESDIKNRQQSSIIQPIPENFEAVLDSLVQTEYHIEQEDYQVFTLSSHTPSICTFELRCCLGIVITGKNKNQQPVVFLAHLSSRFSERIKNMVDEMKQRNLTELSISLLGGDINSLADILPLFYEENGNYVFTDVNICPNIDVRDELTLVVHMNPETSKVKIYYSSKPEHSYASCLARSAKSEEQDDDSSSYSDYSSDDYPDATQTNEINGEDDQEAKESIVPMNRSESLLYMDEKNSNVFFNDISNDKSKQQSNSNTRKRMIPENIRSEDEGPKQKKLKLG